MSTSAKGPSPALTGTTLSSLLIVLVAALVGGCALPSSIQLKIGAAEEAEQPGEGAEGVSIAVIPFQDRRAEPERLGVMTPYWGDQKDIMMESGDVGQVAARLMVQSLRANGMRAVLADRAGDQPQADVVMTGAVEELTVDVEGKFWENVITVKSKVIVQALNRADGSKRRQRLTSLGSQGVFSFAQEDAEALVNEVLLAGYAKTTITAAP